MKTTTTLLILCISVFSFGQSTKVVRPGQNNVPITEVKFTHDGNTITQTSEASGTIANTNKAVVLDYVKINDGGTIKTLDNFNSLGAVIRNNNFTSSTTGVGVYEKGTSTTNPHTTNWEDAMILSGSDMNVLNYLYYDYSRNTPSGADFDIVWTKGWETTDYVLVGERNGNTCFALTPLDSNGDVITSGYKLQFGNCYGTVRAEYDWNIGYAPTNITNQPMVFTVIKASEFNTSEPVFGFRIDNTGDADPKFFGLSDVTFEDNPNNPLIGGISGTLFNDANGLVNNTVDGNGLGNPSSTQMYASLVNSFGTVVDVYPLGTDGFYEFLNVEAGDYDVVVSSTQGVFGQSAPSATLPALWNFVGDHVGTDAGSDGNANGIIESITVGTSFVTDVNFGIDKSPEADDKSKMISSPSLGQEDALTSGNSYPQLSGNDLEDGVQGAGNKLVVTDTANMNGNELYYNGSRVALNSPISNFDPSKLSVKYIGNLTTSFSFNYFFKDAADIDDATPATYTITWTAALPVEWVGVSVKYMSDVNAVRVQWSTAQESNNSHFVVLRSDDNDGFVEVGTEMGQGDYNGLTSYEFVDGSVEPGKTYYYKVKQVDFDGESSETEAILVDLTNANDAKVEVYPNPFRGNIEIFKGNQRFDRLVITDVSGRVFVDQTFVSTPTFHNVNTMDWPTGMYFMTVYNGTNANTSRLIKQ